MSEGIEIRHGCQSISSLVRALAKFPGGLGRFLPCGLGSHTSRLRHLGWNQCSNGWTSLLDGAAQFVRYGETLRDKSGQPGNINSQEVANSQDFIMGSDTTELELSVESHS